MADANEAKKKALQLTLDKLDKTYGKGAVMKMGDEAIEEVEAISSGSIGLDLALGVGGQQNEDREQKEAVPKHDANVIGDGTQP